MHINLHSLSASCCTLFYSITLSTAPVVFAFLSFIYHTIWSLNQCWCLRKESGKLYTWLICEFDSPPRYNRIGSMYLHTLEKAMEPTPVLLPGKSHGWRSLVGYSPWGCEESDTTEQLHFHFSLSCTGEGNGNPLQYSRLENPRDRGAWWLPSMGSHRVGHNWINLAAAAAVTHTYYFHKVAHSCHI